MEGAGDGCCAEREDVGGEAESEESFFVFYAEFLFFVDNDEAQVCEADIFAEQAVCADDDVYLSFANGGEYVVDFFVGFESAERFDTEWVAGEAAFEGSFVLFCEDGCWDEYGDLFAELCCFECGADGEFCFSESDVAADEPVHRARA